jgi:hypothetical protein
MASLAGDEIDTELRRRVRGCFDGTEGGLFAL